MFAPTAVCSGDAEQYVKDLIGRANIAVGLEFQVRHQSLFGMLQHVSITQFWRMMFQELASPLGIGVGKLNHLEDGKLLSSNFNLLRLLEYEPLASAKLDKIDEELIERYIQARRNTVIGNGKNKKNLSPASVNRELATLRRLLYLAKEWKLIASVPTIKMLSGEHNREFVLSREQERDYLDFAPQPLKGVALLILDTGLRIGEVVALQWSDVHLEPVGSARYVYLRIRSGKTKNARRTVSLTARVRSMLEDRAQSVESTWVFPGETEGPFLATLLNHQHIKIRRLLGYDSDFVIHSLRHTMLTRLGEAGVDAFTIMKIADHSSVTVSQRYVHPSPDALERAFERLEAYNARREAATIPATVEISEASILPISIS